MGRPEPRQGFSLVEALVALAIASMTLMAIFELQMQMARGQERAARVIEQVTVQENVLALLRHINPTETPQGTIDLPGGDRVIWSSEAIGSPSQNVGFPSGSGQYEMQLYRVVASIERSGEPSPAPLEFERLGWRSTGSVGFSF